MRIAVLGAAFGGFLIGLGLGYEMCARFVQKRTGIFTTDEIVREYSTPEPSLKRHSDEKEPEESVSEGLEKPEEYVPEDDYTRYSKSEERLEMERLLQSDFVFEGDDDDDEDDEGIERLRDWELNYGDNYEEAYLELRENTPYEVRHFWYYRDDQKLVDIFDNVVPHPEQIVGDNLRSADAGGIGPRQSMVIRNHDRMQDIHIHVEWAAFEEESIKNSDKMGKAVHPRAVYD